MTLEEAYRLYPDLEWYDNHRMTVSQQCNRKGYWHLVGPAGIGLAIEVGAAAKFGSSFHNALRAYYQGLIDDPKAEHHDLLGLALTAFHEYHLKHVYPPYEERYGVEQGMRKLVRYLDHFQGEDALYRPIKAEAGSAALITPPTGAPFIYAWRLDLLVETRDGLAVKETKTAGNAGTRIQRLKMQRQVRGYVWGAQRVSDIPVTGALLDVVSTAKNVKPEDEFLRDRLFLNNRQLDEWYDETIELVRDWRDRKARYFSTGNLSVFPKQTEECMSYGRCVFWDLCYYGASETRLGEFTQDKWNPLNILEEN